ncbi:LysR family transcriptional regulator [Hyphomicrobium facile]|uniref:DNA-binding transcriptional regulator, LysR family n=1 Tax=Hyphomicrobium facile TaxID=51670 RepID=A0A1I7NVF6_9HYPH|nr:LysR family transcriptional regulator [Hyphomicrobium facile]SFV38647.1 DNA-binding transcriptional regulator, LysR family [Hyphomicrobium facile]
MDITSARTFLEVVKTGSFAAAAANLHVTQTAIGARIRVLEQELGRPLFVRNKLGTQLTAAGQKFHCFAISLVRLSEQAVRSIALPHEQEAVISIGTELSISDPLVPLWLVWMRRTYPQFALSVRVDTAERLIDQVQEGLLDAAILYGAPRKIGLIAELIFEEKLVLAEAKGSTQSAASHETVRIDWGEEFSDAFHAAFPAAPPSSVAVSYGPLALEYILAVGGRGYFRRGFIKPYLKDGLLTLVPNSPEFSYSAYVIHSARADENIIVHVREGLRASSAGMAD